MTKFDVRDTGTKFKSGLRNHPIRTLKNNKSILKEPMLCPLSYNHLNPSQSRGKNFVMSEFEGQ